MSKKIKKLGPYLIAGGVFCFLILNLFVLNMEVLYQTEKGKNTAFPIMYSGTRLEQDIVIPEAKTISEVEILFATYSRENQGDVTVSFAVNQNIVDEVTFPANTLKDNSYHKVDGLNIPVQVGDTLTISVVNEADKDNAITIWISDQPSGGELRRVVGDTASAVSGEANVRLYYRISLGDYISSWYLRQDGTVANILILGVCALISLLAFELLQKNEREFAEVEEK